MHFVRWTKTTSRKDALALSVARRPRNILVVVLVFVVVDAVVVAGGVDEFGVVVEGLLHNSLCREANRKTLHHLRRQNSAQVHFVHSLLCLYWLDCCWRPRQTLICQILHDLHS